MRLIDSNILIYSFSKEYSGLRELIWDEKSSTSQIVRLEVLGYHQLTLAEQSYLNDAFRVLKIHEIDITTLDEAIRIRRAHNLKIGDSIVAATALVHGLELYTRNTVDFIKIPSLTVVDPVK